MKSNSHYRGPLDLKLKWKSLYPVLCVMFIVILSPLARGTVVVEKVTGLPTEPGVKPTADNTIYSYELARMLKSTLTSNGTPLYQDLQLVFAECHGGGMVDALTKSGGVPGNYSAVSAVDLERLAMYQSSVEARGDNGTWPFDGLSGDYTTDSYKDKKGVTQYQVRFKPSKDATKKTWYTMDYSAQYILGLRQTPQLTVQGLNNYAASHWSFGGVPSLPGPSVFGGNGRNGFTINGDGATLSKHAILYYGGDVDPFLQNNIQQMNTFLHDDHYDTVTTLFAGGPSSAYPLPGFDRSGWQSATKDHLTQALTQLAASLGGPHQGHEIAFLYFDGHGTPEEVREYQTKDPDPPVPGEGKIYDSAHNQMVLPLDSGFQKRLEQEIPKPGGGFLFYDPSLYRYDPPYLNVTTYSENISGPVQVFLDGISAGQIMMDGTRGEYSLALTSDVLDQLPWSSTSTMNLNISFGFNSPNDWFQIATAYDYDYDPVFSAEFNSYGIGVENTLGQGPYVSPEPSSLLLLGSGFLGLTGFLRKRLFT